MIEIISIHIPKTAGRSFLSILNAVYGNDQVAHYEAKQFQDKTVEEPKQFITQLKSGIKVIHGHFYYNDIKELHKSNSAKIITWLRDPVERVISNYSFFIKRAREAESNDELIKRKNETLLEYASLEKSRNRMSKFIEGIELENFYFIGIMEFFENDIRTLSEKLKWKPVDIPKVNVNYDFKSNLPSITDKERKTITDLNKSDIELYNKVLMNHNKKTK